MIFSKILFKLIGGDLRPLVGLGISRTPSVICPNCATKPIFKKLKHSQPPRRLRRRGGQTFLVKKSKKMHNSIAIKAHNFNTLDPRGFFVFT
jgi:hypothetical protein